MKDLLLPDTGRHIDRLPQATCIEARHALFLPVAKLTGPVVAAFKKRYPRGREIPGPGFTVKLDAPLTQAHKSLLEVLVARVRHIPFPDGAAAFFFTRYWLAKQLGDGERTDRVSRLITDLQKSLLTVTVHGDRYIHKDTQGVITRSGVVTRTSPDSVLAPLTDEQLALHHELHYVVLNPHYMRLFSLDQGIYYGQHLSAILSLRHAQVQALVRTVFSHERVNRPLLNSVYADGTAQKGLLEDIGISDRSRQYAALRMVEDSKDALAALGIEVRPDRRNRLCVYYTKKKDDVYICSPQRRKGMDSKKAA